MRASPGRRCRRASRPTPDTSSATPSRFRFWPSTAVAILGRSPPQGAANRSRAGTEPVVIDVYAYAADGKADVNDAKAGSRVVQLSADCSDKAAFARPIDVKVNDVGTRNHQRPDLPVIQAKDVAHHLAFLLFDQAGL